MYEKGLCYFCAIVARHENDPAVECPGCKREFNGLLENGLCLDCSRTKSETESRLRAQKARLAQVFGEEAGNTFRLENFKELIGTEGALAAAKLFHPRYSSLFFYGPTGRGKTHLAFAVGIEHFLQGSAVDWVTPEILVQRVRGRGQKYLDSIKYFVGLDVLILDELGLRPASDNFLECVCEIMNQRKYAGKRGLIVTSNLYLDDLAKLNGEDRFTSRLAEECAGNMFEISTPTDFRIAPPEA